MGRNVNGINLGIIGAGVVSTNRHSKIINQIDGVDCRWVFDLNRQRASTLAKRFSNAIVVDSLDEAPETDAILIATPVGTRDSFWEVAHKNGWSVFSEKPLATTMANLEQIIANTSQAGGVLGTGFNRRSSQAFNAIKMLSGNGFLDHMTGIHISNSSVWSNTGIAGNWFVSNPQLAGGGVLVETGSHLLDQAACALDLSFQSIDRSETVAIDGYTETEASGVSTVQFQDRALPMTYRFSVRDVAMNGIFFALPNGFVHCDTTFAGNLCFRNKNYEKVFEFALPTSGGRSVEEAAYLQWADFKSRIDAEPGSDTTEFERGAFTVKFVEQCYANAVDAAKENCL